MKITAVEATPVSQRVRPEVAIVSAAGSQPESHFVVVRIRTDEGHTGFGECSVVPGWSGETQQSALHAVCEVLSRHLLGQDPRHTGALADLMDRFLWANPFTKAGVEMALLDAAAKSLGVPAHILLGGPRRAPEIPMRFSIGAFPPAEAGKVAERAMERGLRAVKVKVGIDRNTDRERVEAVRSAVGGTVRVGVDANGGWNESEVLAALPYLERLGVNVIEQPLPRGDFRGCARLRRRTAIPLMLDESIFTRQHAAEAICEGACDIVSVYPGKNGGILRSLEIAHMGATAGIRCTIGSNLEMDLGTAAMLHLAVALPALAGDVDHDVIGPLYYDRHFSPAPIHFRNGCAVVPDGPGLGVEFDPEL